MKRANIILWVGIGCIALGIALTVILMRDYMSASGGVIHFGINKQASSTLGGPSFQDLGTVLAGTVGLLLSLASVFFFTYSLVQSQQEARDSREQSKNEAEQSRNLISAQLAQSTFFNLVKSQRELFALKDYAQQIIELNVQLESFGRSCRNNIFINFDLTLSGPNSLYTKQFRNLQVIAESIINIANFVQSELKNEIFYHRTFYLGLSEEEKYLIGFVIDNELEILQDYSFNYTENYRESGRFINKRESPYFPPIEFKGMHFPVLLIAKEVDPSDMVSRIEEQTKLQFKGLDAQGLTLKRIYFTITFIDENNSLSGVETLPGVNSFGESTKNLNLFPMFRTLYDKGLIAKYEDIGYKLNFVFDYNKTEFNVGWLSGLLKFVPVDEQHKYGWNEEHQAVADRFGGESNLLYVLINK